MFYRRKKTKRVLSNYAFIDSQNLNLGVQKYGWKLDWKKFREVLRVKFNVEKAFMFIGYLPENEDLYRQMQEAGYLVILKPTIDMLTPEDDLKKDDKHITKGNIDTDLVLHTMKERNNYSKAVIVSGDGDFYSLVEYLVQNNKLQCLLAPNIRWSSLLKPFEKYIVRVDSFKREVFYANVKRKPNQSRPNNR
jgi:uncharacterized LabA/DUF88 family protein